MESLLHIKVKTRCPRNSMERQGDIWMLRIQASPVEGQANKAVIEYLAECLGIPKSEIEIIKGQTNPFKTLKINHLTPQEIVDRLNKV